MHVKPLHGRREVEGRTKGRGLRKTKYKGKETENHGELNEKKTKHKIMAN